MASLPEGTKEGAPTTDGGERRASSAPSRDERRDPIPSCRGPAVTLFHSSHNMWSDHFAWTTDGTHITGVTPTNWGTAEALHVNHPALKLLRRYWRATRVQFGE